MNIEKDYSCLEQNKIVYQKCIDVDENYQETLQAYCDDLYRIIKCTSHSYITSVDINYNEVKIFGKVVICVTYYDESSNLCYADFDEEFTKTIETDDLSSSAFASATTCDKYCSYRVINQRRIDIHSSCSINISVYDKRSYPCINSCDMSKLKIETYKYGYVIGTNLSRIEFDEDVIISSSSVKRIISATGYTSLEDIKIIKDKALIKLTANLSILYSVDGENETIGKYEHSFSASKIIDLNGVDENAYPIINASVGSLFFKLKSSNDNGNSLIQLYGDLSVNSLFVAEEEKQIATDGYVINHNSKCEYSNCSCLCKGKYVYDENQQTITFDFNNDIKEVYDLSIIVADTFVKNSKVNVRFNANVVCVAESGDLVSLNSNVEIPLDALSFENGIACVTTKGYDYNLLSNGRIDVRFSYLLSAYFYEEKNISVLSEIDADEDASEYPVLTIYFGKKDESVWSIAKSFSSDIDMIMKENDLSCNVLDANEILIIPGV